jgi:hypothetical protein
MGFLAEGSWACVPIAAPETSARMAMHAPVSLAPDLSIKMT